MRIALLIVAVVACTTADRPTLAQDGEHDEGHRENHDLYRHWIRPVSGLPCCNARLPDGGGDCRPTRAFMHDDGLWRAWDGRRWIQIPQIAMLPPNLVMDGRTHLCESAGEIFCFSPGESMR